MRGCDRAGFAAALHGLRAGSVDFREIENRHRGVFVSIAQSQIHKYAVSHLTVDDLVQEGMLMAWRATVEFWDPSRKVDLDRYVMWRVSHCVVREIKRAVGWPAKGRSKPWKPVRMTPDDEIAHANNSAVCDVDRMEVSELLSARLDGLCCSVSVGVVLGMDCSAIAAYLYSDPACRLRYRFDSMANARHQVRRAANYAAANLASVSLEK